MFTKSQGKQVDPAKVKAILEMLAPCIEKEVRSFLGCLNYISRFISHLAATCEPIFKLLKKDQVVKWNGECQTAFERIKEYLQEPPIRMPPIEGRPLIMYLIVLYNSMVCVLGQHDESGRKEHDIYYLSKKFTDCETTARENLLRFGMGCSPAETVYVDSHYSVDFKNGSNQVHLRKACLVRKNS